MKTLPGIVLFLSTALMANPTPGPMGPDIGFSLMQTLEFTYHSEHLVSEEGRSSVILYGGPTLAYVWFPGDERGEGMGVEAGVELRGYKQKLCSGVFVGAYAGAGMLFRRNEDNIEALSGGFKIGWRKDLHSLGIPFDPEPYFCAGFMLQHNDSGWTLEPAPVMYLGLKLAFF